MFFLAFMLSKMVCAATYVFIWTGVKYRHLVKRKKRVCRFPISHFPPCTNIERAPVS